MSRCLDDLNEKFKYLIEKFRLEFIPGSGYQYVDERGFRPNTQLPTVDQRGFSSNTQSPTGAGQVTPQATQRPQGPTTVAQAAEEAQRRATQRTPSQGTPAQQTSKGGKVSGAAKGLGRFGSGLVAGVALDQAIDVLTPGLSKWAQSANVDVGNVNVSARDALGAGAFELGYQGVNQFLGGPKMTAGSLARGSLGFFGGSKVGESLARALGAEEGSAGEFAGQMAGGVVGQSALERMIGGSVQGQAGQASRTFGQGVKDFGRMFSASTRGGLNYNQPSFNPAARALERGIERQAGVVSRLGQQTYLGSASGQQAAMRGAPLTQSAQSSLRAGAAQQARNFTGAANTLKAGKGMLPAVTRAGGLGALSGAATLGLAGYQEYNKSPYEFAGVGNEASNVATTTALGLAMPAAASALTTLASGGGAAAAGAAGGAALVAAAPLAVAAGGLVAGSAIGRGALSNIADRENARADLETQKTLYDNNKSQMNPKQRADMEKYLKDLEVYVERKEGKKPISATGEFIAAKGADLYQAAANTNPLVLAITGGKGILSREELKKELERVGRADHKVTKDDTGKVTSIQSDVADELKRRAEEKAAESGAKTAAQIDAEQAPQIAALKKQAEEAPKTAAGKAKIKEVETEEEKARTEAAKENVFRAMEAGYEPDPELVKQAGINLERNPNTKVASDEEMANLQASANDAEQFKKNLQSMGKETKQQKRFSIGPDGKMVFK